MVEVVKIGSNGALLQIKEVSDRVRDDTYLSSLEEFDFFLIILSVISYFYL